MAGTDSFPNLSREQLSAAARSRGAPDLAVPRVLPYVRLKALADTPAASAA